MTYFEGNVGPVDYEALEEIRDVFLAEEPLVSHHDLSGRLDPQPELTVAVDAGFTERSCGRFDIVWTEQDCYHFHYTEPDGIQFRFDRHPDPHAPERHFHEPPNGERRVPSCISVEQPALVTRVVIKCWRTALSQGDTSVVNRQSNPP